MTEWPIGRGLAYNADYWREISQRGWLGSVGAPGTCSIYAGHHRDFAEQCSREKLVEKLEGKAGMYWRWNSAPGKHDYGDALTMAYVAAAWQGIGTSGPPKRRRYKERRKAKVPIVTI